MTKDHEITYTCCKCGKQFHDFREGIFLYKNGAIVDMGVYWCPSWCINPYCAPPVEVNRLLGNPESPIGDVERVYCSTCF